MKRLPVLALVVAVAFSVIVGTHSTTKAQKSLKIGLVTDVGKVDDRTFNQSAWEGAQAGAKATGSTADYIETTDPADYANNIQQFVDKQYDVIITVGFALGDATNAAAAKNPNIKFINIDVAQDPVIPNVTGLIFHEDEAGFLVGYLAASVSKSGIIGGVYGTDQVPPVVRYKEGYDAGAKYANPNIKILSTYYPGDIGKAFNDPEWGATTAGQALDQGADVIFGAGGKTGDGALGEVAKRTTKDKPLYCIGVDLDEWDTFPDAHPCLISSAEKLIIPGLTELIQDAAAGTLTGGNVYGTTSIAPFHDFDSIVPAALKTKLTSLTADLDSGALLTNGQAGTPAATMVGTMSSVMTAATMSPTAAK